MTSAMTLLISSKQPSKHHAKKNSPSPAMKTAEHSFAAMKKYLCLQHIFTQQP
jgi:hypothetical protein